MATVAKFGQCFEGNPKLTDLKFDSAGADPTGSVFLAYNRPGWADVQYVYVVDRGDRVVGAFEVGTYSGPALAIN